MSRHSLLDNLDKDHPLLSSDDDNDDDDDERYLTQPPSLHNTIRIDKRLPFLDSVRRVIDNIDNKSLFNLRQRSGVHSPPSPHATINCHPRLHRLSDM